MISCVALAAQLMACGMWVRFGYSLASWLASLASWLASWPATPRVTGVIPQSNPSESLPQLEPWATDRAGVASADTQRLVRARRFSLATTPRMKHGAEWFESIEEWNEAIEESIEEWIEEWFRAACACCLHSGCIAVRCW